MHQRFRTLVGTACSVACLLMAATIASAAALRFEFAAFGSFKRLAHTGDASGQVNFSALPQITGHWGVGALAGMAGEVLLYDGRLLVSRGDDPQGRVVPARPDDVAALFAVARVERWDEVMLPSDMSQREFEAFVVAQAQARGLDGSEPYPMLVQGHFPSITWHVVTGQGSGAAAPAGGHGSPGGHAQQRAGMRVFDEAGANGRLVGMYSGARFEGVISHPGERFHFHYLDQSLGVSGHVDAVTFAKGSVPKLPLR